MKKKSEKTEKMTEPEEQKNVSEPMETMEPAPPETAAEQAGSAADPLAELRRENAELKDKFLYLSADYQNYRKRVSKDLTEARLTGTVHAVDPFLKVNDFLLMARQAADRSDNLEALRQGVQMIIKEYDKALEELGVTRLVAVGAKFDPELHEAVAQEPSDTVPEGHIIKEWSGGYKLGERLLRPARVVVSTGPAPEDAQ